MTARSLIISSDVIRLPNRLKTQRKVIQFSEIEKPKRKINVSNLDTQKRKRGYINNLSGVPKRKCNDFDGRNWE